MFTRRIPTLSIASALGLLAANIGLVVLYTAVPVGQADLRLALDMAILVLMSSTMLISLAWLFKSF